MSVNMDALSFQVLRDATGNPHLGAKASYWSDVGLSVPLATYSDANLASANTQPVVSDGTTGAFPVIYLASKRYWRSLTTSAGVSLPSYNAGPIDPAPGFVSSTAAPSPTYPFLYWHDQTTAHLKRRNAADSAWLDLGGIDSLLLAATVAEQLAGTSAAVSSTPDSVAALWQRGTSITPSAGTVSLPSTGGGVYTINAGNFSAISSAAGGRVVVFEFAGASVITHAGASMDLPGNANITTAAGDRAAFVNLAAQDATGSNWRCLWFTRDDGSLAGVFATQAQQETGTQTTFPINSAVQHFHNSAVKCHGSFSFAAGTNTSYNVTSIADTGTGRITVTIANDFSSANWTCIPGLQNAASGGLCAAFGTKAAGSVELRSSNGNTAALQDADNMDFAGLGDL